MNNFLNSFKQIFRISSVILIFSSLALASEPPMDASVPSIDQKSCEAFALSNEIENRFEKIRKNLEENFSSGLPHKLKTQLIDLRSDTDNLSQKMFDTASLSEQEVNSLVQDTLNRLEKFIQLLPEIADNAPKVRDQYVVPFTNISSLKAEHQDCLMSVAVEQVQTEVNSQRQEASTIPQSNTYKKLTDELNSLNDQLYLAETTDVQKFIQIRAQLLSLIENYNSEEKQALDLQRIVGTIPMAINSVQSEIEKLLPGLQLSENYYSLSEH